MLTAIEALRAEGAALEDLLKGAVRAHTRRTRSGKTVTVRAHERTGRKAKAEADYSIGRHDEHLRGMEAEARRQGHHEYADDLAAARVHATHGPAHEQIRAAYHKLSGGDPQAHVSLADLRDHLHSDLPRSHVDRALTHGFFSGSVHLRPNENTKALTSRDHDAAITVGEKARHLVRVS